MLPSGAGDRRSDESRAILQAIGGRVPQDYLKRRSLLSGKPGQFVRRGGGQPRTGREICAPESRDQTGQIGPRGPEPDQTTTLQGSRRPPRKNLKNAKNAKPAKHANQV